MQTLRIAIAFLLACGLTGPARADRSLEGIESIGVYSMAGEGSLQSLDISAFLAGYLGNIKNYRTYNFNTKPGETAQHQAAELGVDALLSVEAEEFRHHANTTKARLRLLDVESGEEIREWSATLEAPYFDPPQYWYIQPYGNLDQVFAEFPLKTYQAPLEIRLLAVSDQRLRGSGAPTKEYLLSQLEVASRILEREFGIRLKVERVKRWAPPDVDIYSIAKAAASIKGREDVDLTLVCLGPPAPVGHWNSRVAGYARVLTNTVVTRVMNAHVFVHEIGHVLGAIHLGQEDCIMEPVLRGYAIDQRFKVLPPMVFSSVNRRIIDITKTVPLGADYEQHTEKIERLIAAYEQLRGERLKEIAPYYGDLLADLGRTDEAIELFQDALEEAPNETVVRVMLVDALQKAGRYQEAQEIKQDDFDASQAALKGLTQGGMRLKEYASIKLSPSFLSFGQVPVGQERALELTIANLGTASLDLSRFTIVGLPFALGENTPRDAAVEPGESLGIQILFQPATEGQFQSALEISSNARGSKTAEVRLSGQGME
jgi:hypothetical protein